MRATFLRLGILGLLAAAAPAVPQAPGPAWRQFRANPGLTGVTAELLRPPLRVLWSFEAGFSIDSSAAIVDGLVYMTALPGLVAALHLEDG